jgi:hypothetical protein
MYADKVTLILLAALCVLICFAAFETTNGGFARLFGHG